MCVCVCVCEGVGVCVFSYLGLYNDLLHLSLGHAPSHAPEVE